MLIDNLFYKTNLFGMTYENWEILNLVVLMKT